MRRILPIARIFTIYLLLGFITTWAVAWGLALLPQGGSVDYYATARAEIDGAAFGVAAQRVSSIGVCRASYRVDELDIFIRPSETEPSLFSIRPSPPPVFEWEDLADLVDPSGFHGWGMRRVALREGPESRWRRGIDDARGFPLLALWSSRRLDLSLQPVTVTYDPRLVPRPVELVGGIELPDHPNQAFVKFGELRALPYMPIWSGLAINTAFYALLFFACVRLVTGTRHLLRFRRGRCPRCGYDLCMNFACPCSECGHQACARRTVHA